MRKGTWGVRKILVRCQFFASAGGTLWLYRPPTPYLAMFFWLVWETCCLLLHVMTAFRLIHLPLYLPLSCPFFSTSPTCHLSLLQPPISSQCCFPPMSPLVAISRPHFYTFSLTLKLFLPTHNVNEDNRIILLYSKYFMCSICKTWATGTPTQRLSRTISPQTI